MPRRQTYAGPTSTGEVTFTQDQTLQVHAGGFTAAGIVHGSEESTCLRPQAPITVKVLGAGAKQKLDLPWSGKSRKPPRTLTPQDALIDVVKLTRNEAILVGRGGCGSVSAPRVSYLTRVR